MPTRHTIWRYALSGRIPALWAQGPQFKSQYQKTCEFLETYSGERSKIGLGGINSIVRCPISLIGQINFII
jgi:hypothetical protein